MKNKQKRRTSRQITCHNCGNLFELPPAKISRSKNLYCSQNCMAQGRKININLSPKELHDRYVIQRESLQSIADTLGVGVHVVKRLLTEEGIERRSRGQWGKVAWERSGPERHAINSKIGKVQIAFARAKSNPVKAALALQNRRGPTSIEQTMMDALNTKGVHHVFQFSVGDKFLCDFAMPEVMLIVECDGAYWHSSPKAKARDNSKDAYLRKCGYTVMRFSDTQIKSDIDLCIEKITSYLSASRAVS